MFSFIQDRHAPGLKNSMTGLRCKRSRNWSIRNRLDWRDPEPQGSSTGSKVVFCFDSRRPAQFYGISYKSSLSTIKGKAGSNFSIGRKASTARGRGSSGKRGARNS